MSTGDELDQAVGTFRQTIRLALAHVILQLVSGTFWNSLALIAFTGMQAIPDDIVSAHSWLRNGLPIALAVFGMLTKGVGQHADAVERCLMPAPPSPKGELR